MRMAIAWHSFAMCAQTPGNTETQFAQSSLQQVMHTSLLHHQAGRLKEAAQGYEAVLRQNPQHSDALHCLGLIAQQLGQLEMAIQLIKAAMAVAPAVGHYHQSLGSIYAELGRKTEAQEQFQQAAKLDPAYRSTPSPEAVPFAKEDLNAEAYWEQGNQQFQRGNFGQAEALYRHALVRKPSYPECNRNLGQALIKQNRFDEAVDLYRQAIRQNPQYASAYCDLGFTLMMLEDLPAAEEAFVGALKIKPDLLEAHYNLGNLFRKQSRLPEAIASYRKVLSLRANKTLETNKSRSGAAIEIQAKNNLALSLSEAGKQEQAIACYREALVSDPQNAILHYNLATALLATGNFLEGWEELEWRWKMPSFTTKLRDFGKPLWKGEPLDGANILLHAEQGYGDTLQFVRYAPLVAERGGKVILEVPPRLHRLLGNLPGVSQVVVHGEALPEFSWHCPLMSLPRAFATTVDTIPSSLSYLKAPEEAAEKERAGQPAETLRVGLAWSGNPRNQLDAFRSMSLLDLSALGQVEGVSFFSLQMGEATQQIAEVSARLQVTDACSGHKDFADTAAFLSTLDLVITVDTSIAHLAGALGIPVWILLAHSRTDWRWLLDRSDSPWYPMARLFRQAQPGAWKPLAETLRSELQQLQRIKDQHRKQGVAQS